MNFWNIIGEILLFRWLFGSHRRHETDDDMSDLTFGRNDRNLFEDNYMPFGSGSHHSHTHNNHTHNDFGHNNHSYNQSFDDFDDEHDDYDMMDDDF